MGFLRTLFQPRPSTPEWLVITEPGPLRGLFRVAQRSPEVVMLEGGGVRVQYAPRDLAELTRAVLSRAEAEARVAELSAPSAPDSRHRREQFVSFVKTVSRGSDADVIALLRARYAQPWALSFGDRKVLDQLERRLLPELAHVLGVAEDALRDQVRARHAVASARGEPPEDAPWPGDGSSEGVPLIDGLEALGSLTWSGPLAIGPRLDRHAEPDSGIALVSITAGRWHAWLERDPEDDEAPRALVLMAAGAAAAWPCGEWEEIASTRPWAVAPGAGLQVIEQASLATERVLDAARYLAGTQTYWDKAVSVALLDGLPSRVAIHVPRGAQAPYAVLSISLSERD